MNRLISFSKLVVIRVERGQKCYGELTLRNTMHTMPVAYKLIHLSKKKRFIVNPQSGILAPLSSTKVEIVYIISSQTSTNESFSDCDDIFQLHSVVTPSVTTKTINSFSSINNMVRNEWFTKTNVFIDCGIKVMIVGPQKLARLIRNRNVDRIRELLEESDRNWKLVDSIDENEQTLLHLAIGQSQLDIVQLLLEFGANVEARSRSGLSPLEVAALAGEELIVELLLAHKVCLERAETSYAGPIHYASWAGHTEILRMLLHEGAQVNARARNGETALHLAVKKRRSECVRLLLASGANASTQTNPDNETPLHIATRVGDQQMVKLLVQKGANKYVQNRFGKTAYHIALENEVTKLYDILRLGDNLCLASREGETRVIQKLIEEGASINGFDQNKWTALHRASFKGKIEAVKALVEKGIDVNATDDEGYTALHCAVETGRTDVTNYLLKNGADFDKETRKGVTALQISKLLGYLSITKILEHENYNQDISYTQVSFRNRLREKEVLFGDIKKRSNRNSTSSFAGIR